MSETPQTAAHDVPILINDCHFRSSHPNMTGAELTALAGLPPTNQLFLEVPGPGDDRPIGAAETIRLHAGMKFYDIPVGMFG